MGRKRLRIALFTDAYDPQVSGVVTSVKNLKASLERKGHEVWVFYPKPAIKTKISKRRHYSLPPLPFPFYKGWTIGMPFGFFIKYAFRPPKIDMTSFDVIHVHSPGGAGIDGILIGKMLNIPTVATYHTFFQKYVEYFFPWIGKRATRISERIADKVVNWFHEQADAIIAPTEGVSRYLKKRKVKKPVFIVPSGVRIPRKRNRDYLRKKLGFDGKKVLLHVARLSPEKNIPILLKMMKLFEKERDDIWLYITSAGPEREKLEKMCKKLGLKRVVFTGYLPRRKLNDFYAAADVFVFASDTETQGIVLMEAAVNGLPIVVANFPIISDFVKKYGGLVASPTPRGMKMQVEKIIDNPELWKAISDGYHRVRNDYSMSKCVDDMIKVYNLVIEIKKQKIAGKKVV